jgi:hypothetical protein
MTVHQNCPRCGQRHGREANYCSRCAHALRSKAKFSRPRVEHLEPYPDLDAARKPKIPVMEVCGTLKGAARSHPYLTSIGAVAVGLAAVWAAPTLITIGTAICWIGAIITGCGFLTIAYGDREESMRWLEIGLLTLLGGAAIMMVGYAMALLGICSVAGGTGVALKAGGEEALRWRLRKKMESKSFAELLEIARRMEG